jgi:hypothetical protein
MHQQNHIVSKSFALPRAHNRKKTLNAFIDSTLACMEKKQLLPLVQQWPPTSVRSLVGLLYSLRLGTLHIRCEVSPQHESL